MDDSCAVCAETLQWVAYGPCGHREVCSTCTIRLRFICEDSHCCLCKSESKIIFVTKALGEYTRKINDFSVFPADPVDGQVGKYWYHEGTQAFFDDFDHYKIIKATCRLSCGVCDKINGSKGRGGFKNVELLKSHLFRRHKLFMCSLCLGGRKIFICEQKLYNKAQLDRHTATGDSEVDGSETERGGFDGHPMCEFCRKPFYGDNELYVHMSTEHYTCYICQRQHPEKYDYFKDYNDLENHFSQAHFLCKDEACLSKKFVVFASESEIKMHNAKEHGGKLSRSRRNIALQIPVSFRCRRGNEQDPHGPHDRGHGFQLESADNQLSLALQASVDTATAERFCNTSSRAQEGLNHQETSEFDTVGRFGSLATTESESLSTCSNAIRENSRNGLQEESAFPPLPLAQGGRQHRNHSGGLGDSTMASRISRINKVTVINSAAWPTSNHQPKSSTSSSHQKRHFSDSTLISSSNSPVLSQSTTSPGYSVLPSQNASSGLVKQAAARGLVSSNFATPGISTGTSKVTHTASVPNLINSSSLDTVFPSVSDARTSEKPASSLKMPKVVDVQAVNKSLVEKIRGALEFDESKFSAFKEISSKYRRDIINTGEYLAYVYQFGLSHLLLELARLCPDADKQRELVETYNFNIRSIGSHETSFSNGSSSKPKNRNSNKGKEKCEDSGVSNSKDVLPDSPIASASLHSNDKPPVADAVVQLKGVIHSAKGKLKISVEDEHMNMNPGNQMLMGQNGSQSGGGSSKQKPGTGGGNKQQKKTSKFLRTRLGNYAAALSELGNAETGPDLIEGKTDRDKDPPEALPVGGVWKNGGGWKLVKMAMRDRPLR